MTEVRYVCEGTCGGMVSKEEFKAGKNKCSKVGCTHHGKKLVRMEYCPSCNNTFEEGEDHFCTG